MMQLTDSERAALISRARAVRAQAYAPYSGFQVGAVLRADDGTLYTGVNVENASFGLTVCAERNAVAQAVACGRREFVAIAVVSENGVTPCGACRQVLAEFSPELIVITADMLGNERDYVLTELLPAAFGAAQLPK
jgi:cytidine deaminase